MVIDDEKFQLQKIIYSIQIFLHFHVNDIHVTVNMSLSLSELHH